MADDRNRQQRRTDALALQAIEGNPLDADDLAMFEMFDRNRWSDDQRRRYIVERALAESAAIAAE